MSLCYYKSRNYRILVFESNRNSPLPRVQVSYGSRDMGKRKKATTGAQIREEIRRLNLIAKSEFRRSFDEEAAVDLLLRLGLSEVPEVGISPVIKYRLLVGGVGIAYEGESEAEGRRQFGLFMAESKTARSRSSGESVTLFRNFEVVRRYQPHE
jgi:hypothetical protein